jgi:oxepin-CoA hydrolase/3-oxo-5,6-dehydrosuberyl-CoA semialdehyde dehydrogenase
VAEGAFFAPTLLLARYPAGSPVHEVEAFGPVSTLMPYDDLDEAWPWPAGGRGSLVASLVTRSPRWRHAPFPVAAAWHGRLLVLDAKRHRNPPAMVRPCRSSSTAARAAPAAAKNWAASRAVKHYLQRTAVQGSPTMLAAVVGEHVRGARCANRHPPFRHYFEDLQIGDSATHRRTVTEADIVNFGCLSGDHFYMHFDDISARQSPFGKRIAHGYFVLSAAAGLFVSPAPGPVLANYGLDTLRFVKPVGIGDTIAARLTCKRKIDRNKKDANGQGQGVVAWDVEVSNQDGELVASYDILTLVAKQPRRAIGRFAESWMPHPVIRARHKKAAPKVHP